MRRKMPKNQLVMIMMLFGVLGMNLVLTQRLGRIELAETYDPDFSDDSSYKDLGDFGMSEVDGGASIAADARKWLNCGKYLDTTRTKNTIKHGIKYLVSKGGSLGKELVGEMESLKTDGDKYTFHYMTTMDDYDRTMVVWKAKNPSEDGTSPYLFSFYTDRNLTDQIGRCIERDGPHSGETMNEMYKSAFQEHLQSEEIDGISTKRAEEREVMARIKECKVAGALNKAGFVKRVRKEAKTAEDKLEFHRELLKEMDEGFDDDVKKLDSRIQKKCFVKHLKEVLAKTSQEDVKVFGEDILDFVNDLQTKDQVFTKDVKKIVMNYSKRYVSKAIRTEVRDEVKEYVDELKELDEEISENQRRIESGNPYEAWSAFAKNNQLMMKRNYLSQKAGRFLNHRIPKADELGWIGSDQELKNLILKDGSVRTLKNLVKRNPWDMSGSGGGLLDDDRGHDGHGDGWNDTFYNGSAYQDRGLRRPLYGDNKGGGYYDYVHDQEFFDNGSNRGGSGSRGYISGSRMDRGGGFSSRGYVSGGIMPSTRSYMGGARGLPSRVDDLYYNSGRFGYNYGYNGYNTGVQGRGIVADYRYGAGVGVRGYPNAAVGGSRYSPSGSGAVGYRGVYNQYDPYLSGMTSRSLVSPYRGAYYGGSYSGSYGGVGSQVGTTSLRGGVVNPTGTSGRYDYNLYNGGAGRGYAPGIRGGVGRSY